MAKTFKDIANKLSRIAIESVNEWLLDKHRKVIDAIVPRARKETYGGKFSQSIRFQSRTIEGGAEGEIYSEHPRAKEIIKSFEEGRLGYATKVAFFIEKPEYHPGEVTPEGHKIVTNREGVPGIWVRKSGVVEAEHLWSGIAKSSPSLESIYIEKWKKPQGGA